MMKAINIYLRHKEDLACSSDTELAVSPATGEQMPAVNTSGNLANLYKMQQL